AGFPAAKAQQVLDTRRKTHVAAVYAHWQKRRAAAGGRPLLERFRRPPAIDDKKALLERFRRPPAIDDKSPYAAFRPRELELKKVPVRNDARGLAILSRLRKEMGRAQELARMV